MRPFLFDPEPGARSVRPDLTYAGLVNVSPGRVAATLAPLRSLDPEIVLAADDSVDPSWIDGYRRLADRVLVIRFPGTFERAYGWLRDQCNGRWILHLAPDEVPSSGLAAVVAETIARRDVTHAWIPRRWLHPDARSYLAQWPWRPDYQLRLFRNEPSLLRFPARYHDPVRVLGQHRYLCAPIYHADLLLHDTAARERKCARYDAARAGLLIDGTSLNEAYYLPERRDDLRFASVPAADLGAIDAFLEPKPPAGPVRSSVERVDPGEVASVSEDRSLGDSDYTARLTLLDDDLRLVCGEARTFDVEVTNLGTTNWPGGLDAHPQIRLAYSWNGSEGERTQGGRTPLGSVLPPGGSTVVPLRVVGPDRPGLHEIEIDLVHELVRWFGCAVRAPIEVRRPRG